jgi:hypothetical protein
MQSDTHSWRHSLAWSSLRAWVVTAALVVFGAAYGMLSSRYDDTWLGVVSVSAGGVATGIFVFRWIERRFGPRATFVSLPAVSYSNLTSPGLIAALTSHQESQQPPLPAGWNALLAVPQTQQVTQSHSSSVGLATLTRGQQRQVPVTGLALAS